MRVRPYSPILVAGKLALGIAAFGVAGCNTPPPIVNPPPAGISLRVEGGNRAAKDAEANAYCRAHGGKPASVDSVTRGGSSDIVNYKCE